MKAVVAAVLPLFVEMLSVSFGPRGGGASGTILSAVLPRSLGGGGGAVSLQKKKKHREYVAKGSD